MAYVTVYQKQLAEIIGERYPGLSGAELLDKLFEMGVVDFSRCKVLAVRQYVDDMVRRGGKKTDSMWEASEKFACSYEYVRKCMYYYLDVNIV